MEPCYQVSVAIYCDWIYEVNLTDGFCNLKYFPFCWIAEPEFDFYILYWDWLDFHGDFGISIKLATDG